MRHLKKSTRQTIQFLLLMLFLSGSYSIFGKELTDGGKPQAEQIEGFINSQCIHLPSAVKVCKAQKAVADDRVGKFVVWRNSQLAGSINASTLQSSTELFSAFYGDLDGDQKAELVIVDFTGSSNGMGVRYHTINIFRDFEKNNLSQPLAVGTNDFGRGTFVYDKAKDETLILLTEWRDYPNLDAKPGMYLIGRSYRYADGRLIPAFDKPILARRLSKALDDQRIKDLDADNSQIPRGWLLSPVTKNLTIDPEFLMKIAPQNIEQGVVQKVETITENYTPADDAAATTNAVPVKTTQMLVRTASGKLRVIILKRELAGLDLSENADLSLPSDRNKLALERFGLLPRKIAFAEGVDITDYLTAAQLAGLSGTKVTLITETSGSPGSKLCKIWLNLK